MDLDDIQEWRRKRLNLLADARGGKAQLGRELGYKDGAFVGQMINGDRPVTEKTIERAETLPGCAGWFSSAAGLADSRTQALFSEATEGGYSIRLLANGASMGPGTEQHDDVVVGRLTLSPTWISKSLKPLTSPENLRFIHGYGDSMHPTFVDGDILLVDAGVREVRVDGIYVLEANERLYVKRVRQRMDGTFEVSSDNPTVKTVDVLDGTTAVSILGRVVWLWNGRKL